MRIPAKPRQGQPAKVKSFPAPVGGWVANQNRAAPDPKIPASAAMLENWFPTATGARMRAGSQLYATVGDGSHDVASLFAYMNGSSHKLFAATDTAIYDISSIADATVSPSAAVSSLTGADWSAVQFSTAGGTFLRAVNGLDTPQVFDGTSWATTPALTGMTVQNLSHVWAYKQRLFFVEKDSLNAWYLAVDTIGGALTKFPLGGIFQRGGSLLFGASWSLNSASGLSDSCLFVTTEGEVAVYQGVDPASWSIVGLYRIGRPLGPKAWIRAGGDIVIGTDIGAIPLSQAVQRDVAALAPAAVSYPIETEWNAAVASRGNAPWHCEVWPTKQMVLVVTPSDTNNAPQMLVANARTGAWARFTGWDATCLQLFGDRLFFGSSGGKVVEAEVTGADQGAPYTATCVPLFDDIKSPAALKTAGLARAVLLAPAAVNDQISIQTDYAISLPAPPDEVSFVPTSLWGSAVWGESVWGAAREKTPYQVWRSVYGAGHAIAPALQITSGTLAPPDVELVRIDLTLSLSDIVT